MRALLASLVLSALVLTGCSGSDTPDTPTPSSNPSASGAGSVQHVDTYPAFEPQDYSYNYVVSCRCTGRGDVRVVVENGVVKLAEWGKGDHDAGPVPEWRRVTIQGILDKANDATGPTHVIWPSGQDWPLSVQLSPGEGSVDGDVTYTIESVLVPEKK